MSQALSDSMDHLRSESHGEIGLIIEAHAAELVEIWCARAVLDQPAAHRVHATILRDDLPEFLRSVGTSIRESGETHRPKGERIAGEHGEQRWENGWSITELVRDYQILQVVILEYLEDTLNRPLRTRETMAVGVFISDAIAESINRYVASRDAHVQQSEQARADMLAEINRRKDEFMAMLGHELRNPLNPIQTAASVLRMHLTSAPPEATKSVDIIERQSRHLVRLIDDLLDLARIGQGRFELRKSCVELNTLLRQAVHSIEPFIAARNHQLSAHYTDYPIEIEADPDRILQIVGNLLTNAAKYTVPGGHIWVDIRRSGDDAIIQVRDDGIGIAPDMLSRIFDSFARVADEKDGYGGLGVGLTLASRLAQEHGGSVQCESAGVGKGATFIFRVPMAPKQA